MELLGLVDIPVWCLLSSCIILLLYIYGTWNYSLWSSQGVPGPRPWPLVGNLLEIFSKTQFYAYGAYMKEYGTTFGVFLGVRPALVVADLPFIKEVLVKRFTNFSDRNMFKGIRPPVIDKAIFFAGGSVWKRIRSMMTPAFSTSKLKLMSHYVRHCSSLLETSLDLHAKEDRVVHVKDLYGSFTMDVIAGTAFGLETNSQTQEGEPFVTHMKALVNSFTRKASTKMFMYLLNAFPFLAVALSSTRLFGDSFRSEHTLFFVRAVSQMIESRRQQRQDPQQQQPQKMTDILQMLVEAEADPEHVTDQKENSDDTKSHRRMTKDEILGQGFIVLLAGYETTATTLQYLTFNLVHHPEVQEKIYHEIEDSLGDAEPTYENVAGLRYLDAAIHETLRLFPPLALIDRQAKETARIQGITIPAGCGVIIPIYAILHDPQFFHDPEQFLPERYLEDKGAALDPMLQELAFGYGPRQCIGMRLALLELKFAAVTILRKFRFLKSPDTPETINLGKSFGLSTPDVPIKVKVQRRLT